MYVLPACWYDLKLFQAPELGNPSCPVIAEPATTSQASAIRYTSAQEFVSSKASAYRAVPPAMAAEEEHTLEPELGPREEPVRSWLRSKSLAEGPAIDLARNQQRRATSTDSPPWWLQGSPSSSLGQDRYQLLTTRSTGTMRRPSEQVLGSKPVSAVPTGAHPDSPSKMEELGRMGRGPDPRSVLQGSEQVIDNKSIVPSQEHLPVGKADDMRGDVLPWIRGAPAFSPAARSEKVFWGRSDSITDEREPMMGQAAEAIELEPDFYALSLSPQALERAMVSRRSVATVWLCQVSCLAAFFAPMVSAIAQLSVLYFLAFQNENMFEEGKWKQPISPYGSLNVMKLISIVVSLFKVSTELQHAQQLCRALFVGQFSEDFRQVAGWWALSLQYSTALCVLFVSLSIVLGATSCVGCFLKIFSVFIIVDMDNLAAKFVNGMIFLEFHVTVDLERLRLFYPHHFHDHACGLDLLVRCSVPVLQHNSFDFASVWTRGQCARTEDDQHRGLLSSKLEVGTCERSASQLNALRQHFRCTMHRGQELAANVSVLLLASVDSTQEVVKVPPRLYWIALESQAEPKTPSSLQVLQGTDANNNAAFRAGSAETSRSQSYRWLELHHPEGAASDWAAAPYKTLLKQEKMYKTTEPFEASFLISGIQADMVAALDLLPSRALAGTPAKGSLLIPACASFCDSCEFAGAHLCDPGRCMKGTHFHSGRCYPCSDNCGNCELNAMSLDSGAINMTDSETIKCQLGGCNGGFGYQDGRCFPCKVDNCRDCNEDLGSCTWCMAGLGLDSNGTCQQCGGPHCRCYEQGGCNECEEGWGHAENATCVKCAPGCRSCPSNYMTCISCERGYVLEKGACARCVHNCQNCSVSGVDSCDECSPGWGLNSLTMKCNTCEVDNCLKCNGDQRRCTECHDGFGLTAEGFVSIEGKCRSCADRCNYCSKAGPAKCDHCFQGFRLTKEGTCERGLS
eukprot:symbB.v1.2.015595.t1/scaffold1127.1/size253144/17